MLKRTLTIIDSSGNMSEIDLNQFGKTLLYMGNNCVISTRETYYVQVSGEALQLMTQECKYSLVKENGNWFMTSFVDINVVSRIKQ